jgi:tRNA G18 (ribose-2'-O)-methylase SpoU
VPLVRIDSIDDPRVNFYRDLPHGKLPRDRGLFIAEGTWLVRRLLASDYETESVLVDQRRMDQIDEDVANEATVYIASRNLLERIVGFNFHQGIIACGRRRPLLTVDQLQLAPVASVTIAVLVRIQDSENLGGILRSCAAFGVDAVVLDDHCVDPFSRRVLRVSMGTVLKLSIVESIDLASDLRFLRDQYDVQSFATVLDSKAEPLEQVRRPDRLAILFGNEADGLPPHYVDLCDRRITIAMRMDTDSLNVSVAAGIFLYHLRATTG